MKRLTPEQLHLFQATADVRASLAARVIAKCEVEGWLQALALMDVRVRERREADDELGALAALDLAARLRAAIRETLRS